jgi:hypothetical protein
MWHYFLHRIFGITPENADHGKLGGGVVAFTAYVVIAFCTAAGGISWALSHDPYLALGVVAVAALVVVYFLKGTWTFADKHPDQAAIGGSWWFKFREAQFAARKGVPELPLAPSVSDPSRPTPLSAPPKLLDPPEIE